MIAATPHAGADADPLSYPGLIDIVVDLRDECNPSRSSKRIVLKDMPRPRSREEIVARLVSAGYAAGAAGESVAVVVVRDVHRVVVCEDDVVWRKGRVNLDTPLVQFYDKISQWQYLVPLAPSVPHAHRNEREGEKANYEPELPPRHAQEWSITHGREAVDVKGMRVRFYRSNKVPDDDDGYPERPGMESCKIHDVTEFADHLPKSVVAKGGVFICMNQHEILRANLESCYSQSAVKVSIGGLNAMTGRSIGDPAPDGVQDYLAVGWPNQRIWVGEMYTLPDAESHPVSTPLEECVTVEGQATGTEDDVDEIFVDVYPKFATEVKFFGEGSDECLDIYSTPRELGFKAGSALRFVSTAGLPTFPPTGDILEVAANVVAPKKGSAGQGSSTRSAGRPRSSELIPDEEIHLNVGMLHKRVPIQIKRSDTVHTLKCTIRDVAGVPVENQCILFRKKRLEDGGTLREYGIQHCDTVHLVLRLHRGGTGTTPLHSHNLDTFGERDSVLASELRGSRTVTQDSYPAAAYDMSAGVRLRMHVLDAARFEGVCKLVREAEKVAVNSDGAGHGTPERGRYANRCRRRRASGVVCAMAVQMSMASVRRIVRRVVRGLAAVTGLHLKK